MRSAIDIQNECHHATFISLVDPKSIKEDLDYSNRIIVMQEDLVEFEQK